MPVEPFRSYPVVRPVKGWKWLRGATRSPGCGHWYRYGSPPSPLRQGEERRPPPLAWLIQYGLNRTNLDAAHTGECWAAAKSGRCRPVSREQALDALR
ncbi:DUF6233 domain-containing protein [Streptomyces echinatus]|uniref:DUF6233 domain-containing protein n=1 Tax=Streptomyces echinatus TaxID=67293 RepID=UPI0037FEC127